MSVEYQVRPVVQLHWASWDDDYVVFDETSGQTHQLDAVRAYVLDLLIEAPRLIPYLAGALSQSTSVPASEAAELIEVVINDFQTIGLVEAIAS